MHDDNEQIRASYEAHVRPSLFAWEVKGKPDSDPIPNPVRIEIAKGYDAFLYEIELLPLTMASNHLELMHALDIHKRLRKVESNTTVREAQ